MRRTKEASWETRNQILDAAEHVFLERGVAATTLAQVASSAHVSRGAIYWHFENKSDLFSSMVERIMLPTESFVASIERVCESDPLGRMRAVLIASLRDAACNPRTWRVLNVIFTKCELTDDSGAMLLRCRTAAVELRARLKVALHEAMLKGQLPSALDVEYASTLLQALWAGVLRESLLDSSVIELDRDAERIVETWLDVLRHSHACLTAWHALRQDVAAHLSHA
ncbi:TetR family transcriptional regulator [Paraburkholderia phymatum]|uniref:TetR family transcriptional regulator n=1 Tax=Paraburkholderia phymatum TaxID=148447 RepID=UPI00317C2A00